MGPQRGACGGLATCRRRAATCARERPAPRSLLRSFVRWGGSTGEDQLDWGGLGEDAVAVGQLEELRDLVGARAVEREGEGDTGAAHQRFEGQVARARSRAVTARCGVKSGGDRRLAGLEGEREPLLRDATACVKRDARRRGRLSPELTSHHPKSPPNQYQAKRAESSALGFVGRGSSRPHVAAGRRSVGRPSQAPRWGPTNPRWNDGE